MKRLLLFPLPLLLAGCAAPGATPPPGAAEAAGAPASDQTAETPIRLIAVGDLMLGTSVKRLILSRGPAYPYRKYRTLLQDADLTFGNLETPLSDRGTPTPGKSRESLANGTNYIFRAPPSAARGLAAAGFDIVSLANNHAMDYGPVALQDTLQALAEQGVEQVGAGHDLDSAFSPVFLERGGQRVAFFGISDILPAYSTAGKSSPGIAPARGPAFERELPARIAAAKREADWVVVSVHWGKESYTGATPKQKRLGRRLVDWGADVVIGHHTHVLGPTEEYRGGVIHYSLGNFVSYPGSRKKVGVWEVRLAPGKRPVQESYLYAWNGSPISANAKAREKVALETR